MKMRYSLLILIPLMFAGMAFVNRAETGPEHPSAHPWSVQRVYVGVKKCKTCHRKAKQGEQYKIWAESKHAQAYATLATDKAKKYGAERGIDNPQTADECLQCHVTGHGVDAEFLGPKYSIKDGVTCESCHGPGGDYYKKKTMIGLVTGDIEPESVGMTLPDETTCVKCHNDKSPAFAGFNFDEYKAKIAHPIPDSTKASLKSKK